MDSELFRGVAWQLGGVGEGLNTVTPARVAKRSDREASRTFA